MKKITLKSLFLALVVSMTAFVSAQTATTTSVTYNFAEKIDSFSTSSYGDVTLNYTNADVSFVSAMHQNQTITDVPVLNKSQSALFVTLKGKATVKSLTLVCKQWTTKKHTIKLTVGSAEKPEVFSSDNFTLTVPSFTTQNVAKLDFDFGSNQIGIVSLTMELENAVEEVPEAGQGGGTEGGGETVDPQPETPTVTEVADLAAFNAVTGKNINKEYKITGEIQVSFVNEYNKHFTVYAQDAKGAIELKDDAFGAKVKAGDKLTGLVAKTVEYTTSDNKTRTKIEVTVTPNPVAGTFTPEVLTLDKVTKEKVNRFVEVKGVKLSEAFAKNNAKVTDGVDTITIRNHYKYDIESVAVVGDKVSFSGIVTEFNGMQVKLVTYEKDVAPEVASFATIKEMVDFVTRPDATEDEMYGIYDVKEPVYVTYIMDPADPTSPMTVQTVGENPLYFTVYVSESGLGQNIEGRPDSLSVGDKLEGLQIGYMPVEEDAGEILSSAALYLEAAKYADAPVKVEYKPVTVDEMNADMVKLVAQPVELKEAVLTYDPDMGASIGEDIMLLVFDDLTELNGKKCNFEGVLLLEGGVYMFGVNSIEEVPSTAVENAELTSNVYSNNGTLFVEAEAGDEINVYTVDGRNIYSAVAASSLNEINVKVNMVIVRVNNEVHKVIMK